MTLQPPTNNELREFNDFLSESQKGYTKETIKRFKDGLVIHPEIVAQRIDCLLAGNYGYAAYYKAMEIVKSENQHVKKNVVGQLIQIVGCLEWHIPESTAYYLYKSSIQKNHIEVLVNELINNLDD